MEKQKHVEVIISGMQASGKTFLAQKIENMLQQQGWEPDGNNDEWIWHDKNGSGHSCSIRTILQNRPTRAPEAPQGLLLKTSGATNRTVLFSYFIYRVLWMMTTLLLFGYIVFEKGHSPLWIALVALLLGLTNSPKQWKKWFASKSETTNEEDEDIVIEIQVINNKTCKEYIYKSENEFGLDWSKAHGYLHIWQCLSKKENHGIAIAAFVDSSIVKVIRKKATVN